MKCPHCHESVSLFSRKMNGLGKAKACPHCRGAVRLHLDWKIGLLTMVPGVLLAVMLKFVFLRIGIPPALGAGVAVALALLPAIRLRPG